MKLQKDFGSCDEILYLIAERKQVLSEMSFDYSLTNAIGFKPKPGHVAPQRQSAP